MITNTKNNIGITNWQRNQKAGFETDSNFTEIIEHF